MIGEIDRHRGRSDYAEASHPQVILGDVSGLNQNMRVVVNATSLSALRPKFWKSLKIMIFIDHL